MAHPKNARKQSKSLKKGAKIEEVKPLFAKCVTGRHYSTGTITTYKAT